MSTQNKENALRFVGHNFENFIQELVNEDQLSELKDYIPQSGDSMQNRWTVEKAKIIFEVLKINSQAMDEKILAYVSQVQYGWQGEVYRPYNRCLRYGMHCKFNYAIKTAEILEGTFAKIEEIFLHEEYGGITTYLFGYCIAALFSSRLKLDNLRIPYYLQIACERNSNTYRLVHEIVHICDVNTGLMEHCKQETGYGYCKADHITLFPMQSPEKQLDDLMGNVDIPIVIDGYDNEKPYMALLREVANIPGRINNHDIRKRFNTMPIFLTPVVRSSYRNVFSMDLTELDIAEDYLELIHKERQILASWALELVKGAKENTFQDLSNYEKLHQIRTNQRPFFNNINYHIDKIRKDYRNYIDLSLNDITNIGMLSYFLKEYMMAFGRTIKLSEEEKALYQLSWVQMIEQKVSWFTERLIRLHSDYSPLSAAAISVETDLDEEESKSIKRKGVKYAKDIVKYYQSYGVAIRMQPEVEFKNDRYIFTAELLPGTDGKLINRYADEVRCLLDVETFHVEKPSRAIKITLSEKSINENSLKKILESPEFLNSKMNIPYAVGYDIMGESVIADVSKFPHMLIGGTSGYGKSSAIHSLLTSIVVKQPPEKVKLLLIDFGSSDLDMFERTPHMLTTVVKSSEIERGRQCILWLQRMMEDRLEKKDSLDVRNREEELAKWPFIICVIDEFQKFAQQLNEGRGNKDSHKVIEDLLARARKVKIHLILATQDATKGNMLIKNTNLPTGIAFKCTNWSTSNAIIGDAVATKLTSQGAMYFKSNDGLKRMQGALMYPEEIIDLLDNFDFNSIKADRQYDAVEFGVFQGSGYAEDKPNPYASENENDNDDTTLFEIVQWIVDNDKGQISNNNLKDDFEMGYNRAKKFIDKLEELGIVTEQKARLPRNVILNKAQAFLKERGCSCDIIEDAANQDSAPDIDSVQVEEPQELSEEKPAATIFTPIRKSDYESVKPTPPVNTTPIPVVRRKSAENK